MGFTDGNATGDDYAYDANGNMTEDLNKGISDISYNYLNLPEQVTFNNGNSIQYVYDASGMKLEKQVTENSVTTTTDYVGPMVYEGTDNAFLNTEEGRVVLEEGGVAKEEYQYNLKDHLGNVRVTFTTASSQQMSSMYLATMEPQVSSLEDSTFNNLEATRQTDKLYNHTPGGNSSARLNAAEGKVMGPSMGLHVMPGDTVKMEVFAKYFEKPKTKNVVTNMASIVGAAFGVTEAGEAPQVASAVKEALATGQAGLFAKDEAIPKAYLNYLFFDKDMKYKWGGFSPVTEGALGKFEGLKLDYVPEEEGYMMVYTANQTNEDLNVYFDDMAVTHISGPIIRTDDYYPFGMTFNTGVLDGALTNKYLYNGKEKQELTGWYDYGARMYDAEIGRFETQDAFAEKYYHLSPYQYAANNPVLIIDVNGDSIVNTSQNKLEAIVADLNLIYKTKYGIDNIFSVEKRVRTKNVRTNDWSIWKPSTWANAFEDPKNETVDKVDYAIAINENFDREQDKYVSAMNDLISSPGDTYLDIVQDNGEIYKTSVPRGMTGRGLLKDYGGGYTVRSNYVILSNKLPSATENNLSRTQTLGATAMHELLYHVHPIGKTEGGNPNTMRRYYKLATGGIHGPGNRQKKF